MSTTPVLPPDAGQQRLGRRPPSSANCRRCTRRRLVGTVLAPHDGVDRQLSVGRPLAEDFPDPARTRRRSARVPPCGCGLLGGGRRQGATVSWGPLTRASHGRQDRGEEAEAIRARPRSIGRWRARDAASGRPRCPPRCRCRRCRRPSRSGSARRTWQPTRPRAPSSASVALPAKVGALAALQHPAVISWPAVNCRVQGVPVLSIPS